MYHIEDYRQGRSVIVEVGEHDLLLRVVSIYLYLSISYAHTRSGDPSFLPPPNPPSENGERYRRRSSVQREGLEQLRAYMWTTGKAAANTRVNTCIQALSEHTREHKREH